MLASSNVSILWIQVAVRARRRTAGTTNVSCGAAAVLHALAFISVISLSVTLSLGEYVLAAAVSLCVIFVLGLLDVAGAVMLGKVLREVDGDQAKMAIVQIQRAAARLSACTAVFVSTSLAFAISEHEEDYATSACFALLMSNALTGLTACVLAYVSGGGGGGARRHRESGKMPPPPPPPPSLELNDSTRSDPPVPRQLQIDIHTPPARLPVEPGA